MRVWVTGAGGSIGTGLLQQLDAVGTDLDVDVTDRAAVRHFVGIYQPDLIFHCAGAKHAPEGETDPGHVAEVNIGGTRNILEAAGDALTVLASTCKAADPETAYGASKLIAERMVLNAGGSVARFYNVIETQGNVFQIWRETPPESPLPVIACWRYFIHLDQALRLMVACSMVPSGRYSVDPGDPVFIPELADRLYPTRKKIPVPPRRGDRIREPLLANCEKVEPYGDLVRIVGPHDFSPN